MGLSKRYCVEYVDGTIECFREGFWYSEAGVIVKWAVLAAFFFFFTAWFLGGYIHAKHRLKKGKPLLAYHRWLVSYSDRRKYGQTQQNDFSFYAAQPYGQPMHPQHQYQQRADGTWPEPPPMYTPGKENQGPTVEMPMYGAPPPPMGQQQTGVVGGYGNGNGNGNGNGGVEGQQAQLPPRPQKAAVKNLLARFRK
ncbi:hypothetical protein CC80DRAFT_322048 [Byssothecium circinans]|uniref:Ubiquitin-protein ligase sel1 n=1 Tax=Byssothecium circinans TaxID=147558 RepID=A0A6A5U2S1_9PLEO|nr:hypothetical protein CC80DRAFT_322048 [Byssothecium circinans]